MLNDIQLLYQQWAKTPTGKVVRDFMWSVLSAAVIAGLVELAAVMESGEVSLRALFATFTLGSLVGAGKAISLYLGKYR